MNKEIRGLHEAAYLLAVFAFLSQILALVRDRAFAHLFGAGPTLDAYFAAFRVPDLLFAFLTLFISSFAIIPLLAERGGPESKDARSLIGSILLSFGVVGIATSIGLFFALPFIIPMLFPGFATETQASVVLLSQIMLLQPLFLGLSSVIGALVQASRKFFIYALAPIFYNLGIIAGAFFLYPSLGSVGLAWGVVLGAVLHISVQIVPLVFQKDVLKVSFSGSVFADSFAVARRSFPRALALSANQVLMLVLTGAASLAAAGSVAAFSFAFNLQSVPLSIVGVSYAAAIFPSLALLFSKGEIATFVSEVWAAVRHIIFWTAPAIALMIVLRAHIVRVVLGSGAFSWDDTRLTAAILAAFVISLVAQAIILIFSRGYYAARREVVPVVMNVGIAASAGVFALGVFYWFQSAGAERYFLEHLFRIDGLAGSGAVVIALAYSSVMILGALVFAWLFARQFGFERSVSSTLFCSISASVVGATAAYATLQVFGPLLPTETFVGIFIQGLSAGFAGLCAWAVMLLLLKSQEFKEVLAVMLRLVRKNAHKA